MKINPTSNISFGYSSILKTAYKEGKLATVTKDFYGSPLTKDTVTIEHLLCRTYGGKNKLSNYVLATTENNNNRGCKLLSEVFNSEAFKQYCEQFKDIKIKYFNGNNYVKMITKTVNTILNNGM